MVYSTVFGLFVKKKLKNISKFLVFFQNPHFEPLRGPKKCKKREAILDPVCPL